MRAFEKKSKKVFPVLFLILCFLGANAQTAPEDAIVYTIANDVQVNPRQLEFDLLLWDSIPSEVFQEATVQAGIQLNPAIYNGGTITCAIIVGTSTLNATQQPTSIAVAQSANIIKLASKAPPGCGNGTQISQDPNNRTRVCRIRLTNTADFTSNTHANLTFCFTTVPYPSKISYYEASSCTNMAAPVGSSNVYSMADNVCLNCVPTCPFPYQVTGSGSYCTGGAGLIVGLAGSEAGVTYTLYKDGVAQIPSIAGTGAAISFGNQLSGTYTITGVNSVCPEGVQMTGSAIIIELPIVTPAFAALGPYCQGFAAPVLQTTSTNGIAGTWNPDIINTANPGTTTYTFTPLAGQCANSSTMNITVDTTYTPIFTPLGPYCQGDTPGILPGISINGISGIWDPAAISTANTGTSTYLFTPDGGQCSAITSMSVIVNPIVTPSFNPMGPYCQFTIPQELPGISLNGITGTWNPATINTNLLGTSTYTFIPDGGQCAVSVGMDIEIGTQVLPIFATIGPLCQNSVPPVLPGISLNGFTGTWIPVAITTTVAGTFTFTFTPDVEQCALGTNITVEVTPLPSSAGPISGPVTVSEGTPGIVYSVEPINDASGYYWVYSGTGVTIIGNGPIVSLDFAQGSTSGELSVNGYNSCGNGTASSLSINVLIVTPCFSTVWTGLTNHDWDDPGNWNSCVPTAITEVSIPAGCPNYPQITAGKDPCKTMLSLTVQDGAEIIGQQHLCPANPAVIQRTIENSDFHYLSSPVNTITYENIFPPIYLNDIFSREYDEPTGNWVNHEAADNLLVGKGYSLQMISAPHTASFTGTLNGADVDCSLSNLNPSTEINYVGWNLLGNPFTSAIDWDLIPTGLYDAQVAVWDESYGGYRYWNHVVGNLPDGIIPAQNGFFVKTLNPGGSSLIIPLAAQVFTNHAFYKGNVSNVLDIKTDANGYSDEAFVHFNEDATPGFDSKYDAFKLWGQLNAPQVYSLASVYDLSINELPFDENEAVNLGFQCGINGTYSLTCSGLESFDASTPIWLEDLKTNIVRNLRNNPVYSFDYSTMDNENRFRLHFKSAFGVPENKLNGIDIYSKLNTVVVKNSTNLTGDITIYDITGRKILQTSMKMQNETRIPVQFSIGNYLVRIRTENDIVCKKVFIR